MHPLLQQPELLAYAREHDHHLVENYRARDLDLDPEDVERIEAIDREERLIDPEKGPWNW